MNLQAILFREALKACSAKGLDIIESEYVGIRQRYDGTPIYVMDLVCIGADLFDKPQKMHYTCPIDLFRRRYANKIS